MNLQDHLRSTGHPAADLDIPCEKCGKVVASFGHKDVRDNDLIPHDFVCGMCHVDWRREMAAVWGSLNEPTVDWSQILTIKRALLNETMWATAVDGTVENREAWLGWRRSVAAVGPDTHAHPREVIWPSRPE